MGFDLMGKSHEEKGKYFRNNCWWWRPLWQYIADECKDILTAKDISSGCYNDGHFISAKKAFAISQRLDKLIAEGKVKDYEIDYKLSTELLPDEICDICNGTGQRNDFIMQGECNACNGTGKRRPSQTNYPFDEQNVKEFAEFCRLSNGFEIW